MPSETARSHYLKWNVVISSLIWSTGEIWKTRCTPRHHCVPPTAVALLVIGNPSQSPKIRPTDNSLLDSRSFSLAE